MLNASKALSSCSVNHIRKATEFARHAASLQSTAWIKPDALSKRGVKFENQNEPNLKIDARWTSRGNANDCLV
jgi:hypothetical protein